MPVDPQIQALLDQGTGVPATHTLPLDVARAQYEARIAWYCTPRSRERASIDLPLTSLQKIVMARR